MFSNLWGGEEGMEFIPCNIYLEKCVRCERDGLFVAAMELYTKTSTIFVYITAAFSLCLGLSV